MIPCVQCDMPEYCHEIGRCFRAGIETDTDEGEVRDDEDELDDNYMLRKPKKVRVPKELTDDHRDFLRDVLNF